MGSFHDSVQENFPGAMPSASYLALVRSTIEPLGFVPQRTLPLVSICRDELTADFADRIRDDWGRAFTLAGLGGIPALGKTGWEAAFAHIPDDDGRGRLLVMGFPHIGIEEDGTIGITHRYGQTAPTSTCGALSAVMAQVTSGTLPSSVDVEDYEATKLALRLVDSEHPPTSLVELTHQALEALEADLWQAIDDLDVWRHHDVTVWCGVQIHGHVEDWIWPRDAWVVSADGKRRSLTAPGVD